MGPQNILVIKLGALGDFIQSLGPMRAIRQAHPDAKITLLTTSPFENFAEKSGYFDSIVLDKRPKWYHYKEWRHLKEFLNESHFTRVYDLQNNDRTGLYFKLLKTPKPEWVGIAKGASHRNTSPLRTQGKAFEGHKQTLALAGISSVEIDKLDWLEADISAFNLPDKYVLIVPGCAPNRPEKKWPVENYIDLCRYISKNLKAMPVLIGTEKEADITRKISQTIDSGKIIDLTGKTTLEQIVTLARNAFCAVGNDTGPIHLIGVTSCPAIVIFNENKHSNPKRHAPLGENVVYIAAPDLKDISVKRVKDFMQKTLSE